MLPLRKEDSDPIGGRPPRVFSSRWHTLERKFVARSTSAAERIADFNASAMKKVDTRMLSLPLKIRPPGAMKIARQKKNGKDPEHIISELMLMIINSNNINLM
ncbi:hypothetical protein Y032_0177g623 [Ancylostoma ceylanicum]|uniref:Uncharacterized protein n=1 Tax=Ancylostoma ceylanicum TaxID=53326 RepID=A0A016SUI0_9BILA|nr:hypothetical protein Y032_0177g623 [Ancylostoma ceylanicum]